MNLIQNIWNEEVLHRLFVEINADENFTASETELETHDLIKELKYPQGYDSDLPLMETLDDLNEKKHE